MVFVALLDRGAVRACSTIRTPGWSSSSPSRRSFVLGLLLIPFGMWLEHRRLSAHPGADREWSVIDFRSAGDAPPGGGGAGAHGGQRHDRAARRLWRRCTTWSRRRSAARPATRRCIRSSRRGRTRRIRASPACSATSAKAGRAFVHYKLNGIRQLYHVVTGSYPRPIPGVVADLRPAHEVCGTCHWAGKDFGDVIRVKREYADDEANTETTTILQMHVGGPGVPTPSGRAIHWHADPRVRIEYVSTDAERQTIPYVRVTNAQGQVREFTADGATPADIAKGQRRTMDCIDCHNVVAHRVAPTPEQAVDRAIATGRIQRGLPFVRREGVRLVKASHATRRGRRADHRRRTAAVLHVSGPRRRRRGRRRRERRCRTSTGATCFRS